MKKFLTCIVCFAAILVLCSCGEKNPLVGTWKAESYDELEISDVTVKITEDTFTLNGTSYDYGDEISVTFKYDCDDEAMYILELVDMVRGDMKMSRDYPEDLAERNREIREGDESMIISYRLLKRTLIIGGSENDEFFPEQLTLSK